MVKKIFFSVSLLVVSAAASYFFIPQDMRDKALAFLKNSILIPAREITITKNTWADTRIKLFEELESNLGKIKEGLNSPEIQGITGTVMNIINESQEIIETIRREENLQKGVIKAAVEKISEIIFGDSENSDSAETQPSASAQPENQTEPDCPAENLKCECAR